MIVDSHAHIFPFLGTPAGFPTVADHLQVLQMYMVGHGQPVRRLRDHAIVREPTLAEAPLDSPERLLDVVVLQNAHLYGRINETFAAAVARYPGKFIGLAEVDELHADTPAEQKRPARRGERVRAQRALLRQPWVFPDRQSLNYLSRRCDFLPSADRQRVLGGNLANLFALT